MAPGGFGHYFEPDKYLRSSVANLHMCISAGTHYTGQSSESGSVENSSRARLMHVRQDGSKAPPNNLEREVKGHRFHLAQLTPREH